MNPFGPDGVHVSIRALDEDGSLAKLRAHCEQIDYLTVHGVYVHEDHKRFVVHCTARRGAERLVPKLWEGVEVFETSPIHIRFGLRSGGRWIARKRSR